MASRHIIIFLPHYDNKSDAELRRFRLMAILTPTKSAEKSESW